MIKKVLTILLALIASVCNSQCIDEERIGYGGDFSSHGYTFFCPTYKFSYEGDTSKTWSILDPNDIRQIKDSIIPVKAEVEKKICEYAGDAFFSRMKFSSVDVVYLDSIEKLEGRMPTIEKEKCKGKYYFYYYFKPDSLTNYNIGIAVDEFSKIISPFNFPSKQDYKLIDTTLNVCKVIEIAKALNKNIYPIEEVKFDYDSKTRRFYWLVSQEILDLKEGINKFNQVVIDAAEPKKAKSQRGKARIVY